MSYKSNAVGFKNSIIYGLNFTNDGGTPNTILDIAAGQASDDTYAYMLILASVWTKTTGSWSAGTGNGMLDTGSVGTNKIYAVYLIRKDSDASIDIVCSLNLTSPTTMPTGYTYKRKIGYFQTNSSGYIIPCKWDRYDNRLECTFVTFISDLNSAAPASTNRIVTTVSSPIGSYSKTIINIANANPNDIYVTYGWTGEADVAPSTANNCKFYIQTATGSYGLCFIQDTILVDSNQQIFFRSSASSNVLYSIKTMGWIANL